MALTEDAIGRIGNMEVEVMRVQRSHLSVSTVRMLLTSANTSDALAGAYW